MENIEEPKNPSEQYVHDKNCDCKQMILSKIDDLPSIYKDCEKCKEVREETLQTTDNETYLYGDLYCNEHMKNFCVNCQNNKPDAYSSCGCYHEFCSNCAPGNCMRSSHELSIHLHHHYCPDNFDTCNYRKSKYCPFFHSAVLYEYNKKIFHEIERKAYKAIESREKKISVLYRYR